MTKTLLGLTLEDALRALHAEGREETQVTEIHAPRGNTPRGTLRVVSVRNDGRELVCARFPDTVKEEENEDS